MNLIVDASIVVKWLVAEPNFREARRLLTPWIGRHAPDLMLVEVANTLWKKTVRGEIRDPAAYLDELAQLPGFVVLYPDRDLVGRAAEFALALKHPIRDCLYLACAEATGSVVVTADRRFADKAGDGRASVDVRHIGALDLGV